MVSSSTDMPVRVSECSLTYATIESFTSFAIVVVLYLVNRFCLWHISSLQYHKWPVYHTCCLYQSIHSGQELRKSIIFWALAFASSNPSALLYSSLSYFFPNTSDRNLFFEVSDVNVKLYVPSSFKTTGKSLYMEPPYFYHIDNFIKLFCLKDDCAPS